VRRRKTPLRSADPRKTADGAATAAETTSLRRRVSELEEARERLGRLYASQLEENRRRAERLHRILRVVSDLNSDLDPSTLLGRIADTIREVLGFRIVLIRVREPGTDRLVARAFAGLTREAQERFTSEDVSVDEFRSWLKEEFRVSDSYYISHKESFNRALPGGHVTDLGPRETWEWHQDDVLLVPLRDRDGEITAYFSVDDPVDRLVPTRETVEMMEIFGHHAVVAIENARLYRQLEAHSQELEAAGQRMKRGTSLPRSPTNCVPPSRPSVHTWMPCSGPVPRASTATRSPGSFGSSTTRPSGSRGSSSRSWI